MSPREHCVLVLRIWIRIYMSSNDGSVIWRFSNRLARKTEWMYFDRVFSPPNFNNSIRIISDRIKISLNWLYKMFGFSNDHPDANNPRVITRCLILVLACSCILFFLLCHISLPFRLKSECWPRDSHSYACVCVCSTQLHTGTGAANAGMQMQTPLNDY